MKTISFVYKKPDNSLSERTLMVLVSPSDMFAGIDLSSIAPEDGAEFVRRYEQLHNDFLAEVKELQAEFDVKHNYRQFKTDRMSDVIEI